MKTILPLLFALLLLAAPAPAVGENAPPSADLVETARAAGSFQTLLAAVEAAGLTTALKGAGPLTVFAPTDDAFARLPEGTVADLLRPENRERLKAVLTYHVVSGRVLASDLLAATEAQTLGGQALPIGLRVGTANVTQADILCTNGVIHVIDGVLLPPAAPVRETASTSSPESIIRTAIRRGAPIYNDGQHEACAAIYEVAAEALLALPADAFGPFDRSDVRTALDAARGKSATDRAWDLRHAFDRVLSNATFEPRVEAPLPAGFPGPGPLGRVVEKSYPTYRAARAQGGNPFWTLFSHIKKNDVAMTAPVEMTMNESMRTRDMAFLYESPAQGRAGSDGNVEVVDLPPTRVLSIGMRGNTSDDTVRVAQAAVEAEASRLGFKAAGPWRLMGYNSPMVPANQRFWELQLPVSR